VLWTIIRAVSTHWENSRSLWCATIDEAPLASQLLSIHGSRTSITHGTRWRRDSSRATSAVTRGGDVETSTSKFTRCSASSAWRSAGRYQPINGSV
jgi:hypothetical protein